MVRCRKKLTRPHQTEQQKKTTRSKCRRLLNANRKNDFIIDDDSYFTLSNSSGNDRFYSDNLDNTPEDVMYKCVQKYEP